LRDEARGANSKVSLDGLPESATEPAFEAWARKTTARQGSAQNGRVTHLLACVCLQAHDVPSGHASHPVLDPNAHDGSFEHHPEGPFAQLWRGCGVRIGQGLKAFFYSK
jgi:hypothetical protein